LLVPDDAMFERICQAASLNEIREMARNAGMKPLRADGMEKVKAGLTTLEEVFRVTA
jgi:type II secretory ATPase GspE/PulE/Tfp pilus assembly ATPase PilB-like protein